MALRVIKLPPLLPSHRLIETTFPVHFNLPEVSISKLLTEKEVSFLLKIKNIRSYAASSPVLHGVLDATHDQVLFHPEGVFKVWGDKVSKTKGRHKAR